MLPRHRARAALVVVAVAVLAGCFGSPAPHPGAGGGPGEHPAPQLRMNEVQVLASHNSYHVQPQQKLLDTLRAALGDEVNGWEYSHRALAEQFDAGVRQIELDAFVDDPAGGRYAAPKLVPLVGVDPPDARMARPGIKVFHIQEVDFRSTCPTFVDCLTQVRDWSRRNPRHLPVTIQVEAKDDPIPDPGLGFVTPLPWTAEAFAQLESEILSVFPQHQIVTPGRVKGRYPTLAEAVEAGRWPRLAEARGKVMFVLDDAGEERHVYRGLHPDVEDRLVFVSAAPPDGDAAVVVANDPVAGAARIRDLVADGYIVRTRADADTVEARAGDTSRQEAAWASGAQFVSSDYPFPDTAFATGYVAEVPGPGIVRCNPVVEPPQCPRHGIRP